MKHIITLFVLIAASIVPLSVASAQTEASAMKSFSLSSESAAHWTTLPCPGVLQSQALLSPDENGYLPRLKACTQAVFLPFTDASRFRADISGAEMPTTVHMCTVALHDGQHSATCGEPLKLQKGETVTGEMQIPSFPAGTSRFALYIVSDAAERLTMTNPTWQSAHTFPATLQGTSATIATGAVMTSPKMINTDSFTLEMEEGDVLPETWQRSWCSHLPPQEGGQTVALSLQQCLTTAYLSSQKQEEYTVQGSGSLLANVQYASREAGNKALFVAYLNDEDRTQTFQEAVQEREFTLAIPFGAHVQKLFLRLEALFFSGVEPESPHSEPVLVPDPESEPEANPEPTPESETNPEPTPEPIAEIPPLVTTPAEKAAFDASGVWEGKNVRLRVHPVTASLLLNPKAFVAKLDQVYDYNRELVGGVPYNGDKINIDEACTGTPNRPPAASCPWGYMAHYDQVNGGDYWGLAGPPVQIISYGMRRAVLDFNADNTLTFGLVHEMGHNFDHVSSRAQYMFHTASKEAWANLKLIYALSDLHIDLEWNGKIYTSTEDLLNRFYRAKTTEYLEKNLQFEDLINQSPVAGNLTDLYIGVLLPLIDVTGKDVLFDTIKLYKTQEANIRTIPDITSQDKMQRFGQFLTFWSCKSGTDLATLIAPYRFDVPLRSRIAIQYCLDNPEATKDDAVIVALDWTTAMMYLPGGL